MLKCMAVASSQTALYPLAATSLFCSVLEHPNRLPALAACLEPGRSGSLAPCKAVRSCRGLCHTAFRGVFWHISAWAFG